MTQQTYRLGLATALLLLAATTAVQADGIVAKIVNSPLSAAGLVRDARVGINIYLQSEPPKASNSWIPTSSATGCLRGAA